MFFVTVWCAIYAKISYAEFSDCLVSICIELDSPGVLIQHFISFFINSSSLVFLLFYITWRTFCRLIRLFYNKHLVAFLSVTRPKPAVPKSRPPDSDEKNARRRRGRTCCQLMMQRKSSNSKSNPNKHCLSCCLCNQKCNKLFVVILELSLCLAVVMGLSESYF